jgi:2-polyprenyl-6-methoxyphenol hydroxylase-like FAD-dependent oxidoreductase
VRFERRLAASFGRGRVWLAGDAAHLTGPAGMQSMNAGLAEAHQLATSIARIRGGQAGLEELEAYGRERLADWGFLLGLRGGLRPNGDGFRLRGQERRAPAAVPAGDRPRPVPARGAGRPRRRPRLRP